MEKLSYKSIFALIALVSMIATIAVIPSGYAQNGPIMDILRHEVIKSPDAQLIAMQTDQVDFSPDQIRTPDIEKLDGEGNLITQDLGFHMGFIGWNIRDLASTERVSGGGPPPWKNLDIYDYRSDLIGAYWPPAHVAFRQAMIRGYDQLGIIPPIYGYVVTPVRSLVPPAQSKYYSSAAQSYPYNPGNPFAGPDLTSTCGILKAAGYTFVDVGTIGTVDNNDFWRCPDGSDMPTITLWTPLIDVAPTSYQHGAEFVADMRSIGLAGTTENGGKGLVHFGRDFNEYLNLVYGTSTAVGGQFDAFMVFYSLGRIPSQLYDLMHSSSDTVAHPARRNAVGINDPDIDALCDTVQYSLDPNDIEVAAKEIQARLYDTSYDYALAYMLLYSRSYFNAFRPGVDGVVKSPGYGGDNSWTYLSAKWLPGSERTEDGKTVFVYVNGDEPDSFNYNFATTVYEWNIIGQTVDGLTAVNPYNHADIPWIASDWTVTETAEGMDIAFTIRNDVLWQDGTPFTAYDIEWCLEFLREYQVPRYYTSWNNLTDVEVSSNNNCIVHLDAAGLSLFYDVAGVGALLAPQIWDRAWASSQEVLDYIPTVAYSVAPGYTPGPNPTPTNVMGTGPYIFDFYDTTNLYDDMHRNPNYFMSQAAVANLMTSMFWEVGDEDYGGIVNVSDLTQVSFAYGARTGGARWNADANFDLNGIIDIRDLRTTSYHLTWQKFWTA